MLFSLLKTKLLGSLFSDLELVKTVHPNFLIVFAKKLLKPHPKIKIYFLFNEFAGFFISSYSSTYVLINDENCC